MSRFLDKVTDFYNIYYNLKASVNNYSKRKELKCNREFKSIYDGKRCFILGNGPSLKTVNFSLLRDEYVFTVNQLFNKDNYTDLNSNFHVITDMEFFNEENPVCTEEEYLNSFQKLNSEGSHPSLFLTISAKGYVDKYNLAEKNSRIYFIDDSLVFRKNWNKKIDFTKSVPDYPTVVMQCIQLAVYMGFKEIYLLGCDCTGIVGIVEAAQKKEITSYAFQISEKDRQRMCLTNQHRSLSRMFQGWADIFSLYGELVRYTKERGIKLINCTEGSILDSVPKKSLLSVLNNK